MNSDYPQAVARIVTDYLERLSARLKGMPDIDRQEVVNEIRSHIYESYTDESAGDEIERILKVLRRLGDPADVIASRMPQAVTRLGRGKKAPLYIVAGVLIALFGVPLGLGALALLVGFLAGLFALLIGYFGAAVSLVVAGFATSVVSAIAILAPGILYTVNDMVGTEIISFGPFQHNPQAAGVLGLIVSLIILAVGLLMLWSGKHFWRGFRFVVVLIVEKVRGIFCRFVGSVPDPSANAKPGQRPVSSIRLEAENDGL
ncbi:MAG: hypothetical protein LAP85_27725 [Acidobacteriia bacterium]|nr:hypothetical protein [Terriglobia bacterium]